MNLECQNFNESWILSYFFIDQVGKCVRLICQETISVKKVSPDQGSLLDEAVWGWDNLL